MRYWCVLKAIKEKKLTIHCRVIRMHWTRALAWLEQQFYQQAKMKNTFYWPHQERKVIDSVCFSPKKYRENAQIWINDRISEWMCVYHYRHIFFWFTKKFFILLSFRLPMPALGLAIYISNSEMPMNPQKKLKYTANEIKWNGRKKEDTPKPWCVCVCVFQSPAQHNEWQNKRQHQRQQ